MDRLRIGVVGLGFGRHHVRTLANLDQAEIAAVADRHPDVSGGLAAYAKTYGATPYSDGVEMIEREALDAVSICTSPRGREALIEAAARKGLPMFIEKPWASNLEHARALADLCRTYDAKVMPAFSFRFHPAIVELRRLLDGDLGAPWMLNGAYTFSWVPPESAWLWDPENGNGFFNENSCHLFDAVCYLLGNPVSVSAETANPMGTPSENAAALTLRFAGGAIASLTIGGIAVGAFHDYPRIDVVTENGQAELVGHDHIWDQLTWANRADTAVHRLTCSPEALGNTRYTHAFEHFFTCIRSGKPMSIGIDDGVRAVALAMAVYESARTGQKVAPADWAV